MYSTFAREFTNFLKLLDKQKKKLYLIKFGVFFAHSKKLNFMNRKFYMTFNQFIKLIKKVLIPFFFIINSILSTFQSLIKTTKKYSGKTFSSNLYHLTKKLEIEYILIQNFHSGFSTNKCVLLEKCFDIELFFLMLKMKVERILY